MPQPPQGCRAFSLPVVEMLGLMQALWELVSFREGRGRLEKPIPPESWMDTQQRDGLCGKVGESQSWWEKKNPGRGRRLCFAGKSRQLMNASRVAANSQGREPLQGWVPFPGGCVWIASLSDSQPHLEELTKYLYLGRRSVV